MPIFNFSPWLIAFNNANSVIKLVIFFLTWIILWLPIAIPLAKFLNWHPNTPISIKQKIFLLTTLYLIAPFLAWGVIKIEGISWLDFGLNFQFDLIISFSIGLILALISVIFIDVLQSLFGYFQWQLINIKQLVPLILPLFLVALLVSFTEELVFRGIFLNFLREDFSVITAAIISSAVFALSHLLWERENSLPQLPGLFFMGMVLVIARLVDNDNLGLAIGLHAGWIFTISCLDSADLYIYPENRLKLITGEKGKPLASVSGFLVLIFCALSLRFINFG